jgi:putative hemolysin
MLLRLTEGDQPPGMSMEIILLVGLIFANGLFAMSEIAMVASRKARLQQLADEGDAGAAQALVLQENPTRMLSTVQIGITLISIMLGIVGENALADPIAKWLIGHFPVVEPFAHQTSLFFVVVCITFFSLIFGELVPKRIGQMYPEAIARVMAVPMKALAWATTPFVKLLSFCTEGVLRIMGVRANAAPPVTEEEIHVLMEQGADAGVFEAAEQQMVRNVFRLDERKLTSLMIPRSDIVFLDTEDTPEVTRKKIEDASFSRFPVLKGSFDEVLGLASVKDLLAQLLAGKPLDITAGLAPALYVPETLTGTELIENFRNARVQVALVVDEYGEVQGLVTLKDVVDAILGELPSEPEDETAAVKRDDGSWLLDGTISVHELTDALKLDELPEGDGESFHTLAGMIMMLLGRIPKTADSCEWGGWKFEVMDMDGKRIDKVLATELPKPDPASEDGMPTG